MKRLALVIMAVLLLSLAGCGLPQNVKTQENQALKIAQSIPLPPSFYSPITGHKMTATPIKVIFEGYDSAKGNPLFEFTFRYIDPKPHRFLWVTDQSYSANYYLHIPSTANNYFNDEYQFPLSDLKYSTSLTWSPYNYLP